ncbi:MAG TPA: hypothetical protein VFA10_24895 [Ktedonobacteraceae bacterium]|nr:hypothetical protein [Ktedonobacteraceae bacterium]
MAHYISQGIYTAPRYILDAQSSDPTPYYVQLVQRTGQYSYKGYLAASRRALRTTTEMITITSEQLDQLTFVAGPQPAPSIYVLPGRAIPEDYRVHACVGSLSYFLPFGKTNPDGSQDVLIAALWERLASLHPEDMTCLAHPRIFRATLGKDELKQAVLLTKELKALPVEDLRQIVEAYAESSLLVDHLCDPRARAFFAVFGNAREATAAIAAELRTLPQSVRASLLDDYAGSRVLTYSEAIAPSSASDLAQLSVEQLRALQEREDGEARFCLIDQRPPIEEPAAPVEDIGEEIEPVVVRKSTIKAVPTYGLPKRKFTPTWWKKLVLRGALTQITSQLEKKRLSTATRKALLQKDRALRSVLVNERTNKYRRVHIMPIFANSGQTKGYEVHLYRATRQQDSAKIA